MAAPVSIKSNETSFEEAFRLCSSNRNLNRLSEIIQNNSNIINQQNAQGETLLSQAIEMGQAKLVDVLLNANADPSLCAGYYRMPPIVLAARPNNKEIVTRLITARANVNHVVERQVSALWSACAYAALDVAQVLLDAGADINFSFNGETSVLANIVQKAIETNTQLQNEEAKNNSLIVNQFVRELQMIKWLIDHGASRDVIEPESGQRVSELLTQLPFQQHNIKLD